MGMNQRRLLPCCAEADHGSNDALHVHIPMTGEAGRCAREQFHGACQGDGQVVVDDVFLRIGFPPISTIAPWGWTANV